jgi:hypothetical protein
MQKEPQVFISRIKSVHQSRVDAHGICLDSLLSPRTAELRRRRPNPCFPDQPSPRRSPSHLRRGPNSRIPHCRSNIAPRIVPPCANPSTASPAARRRRRPRSAPLGPPSLLRAPAPVISPQRHPPLPPRMRMRGIIQRRRGRGSPRLWPPSRRRDANGGQTGGRLSELKPPPSKWPDAPDLRPRGRTRSSGEDRPPSRCAYFCETMRA